MAALLLTAPLVEARSLVDVLESPQFAPLELAPLAPALADTVAASYPVASASSSVTYVYDPALETFERRTTVGGPIIGERAETIGKGQLNLGFSYSYVGLATINGADLDDLTNKTVVDGKIISFPVPGGVTLKDGRFTNFLPVRVKLDLAVDAHIFTPSVTYGLTPDWDVNLIVPLVYTAALEGKVLSWIAPAADGGGAPGVVARTAVREGRGPARVPRDYTPRHLADRILRSRSALEGVGLPNGTEIRNSATIQFEIFTPLETNETLNVVDEVAPTCVVDPLPPVTNRASFPVSWTADDPVGEIDDYLLYASADGAPFVRVATTAETSTTFAGEAGVTYAELGTPDTDTPYALCLYDARGGTETLLGELHPASDERWLAKGEKQWLYKDKLAAADGIKVVKLGSGEAGKAKITLVAKGPEAVLPGPQTPFGPYFEPEPRVVVQLGNGDGTCWESELLPENEGAARLRPSGVSGDPPAD